MDLRQMRYFVAVAERLHFAEAAELVHVSQPRLSQQIKLLEQELGVLLLDRTKRTVILTEAGKYFLEEAKLSIEHAARAKAVARKVSRGKLGQVRIGHIHSIPFSGILTKVTSAFSRYAPDVHLDLLDGDPVDLIAGIKEQELDLAFIRLPREGIPPEVTISTIYQEKSVLALRDDHWLAQKVRIQCVDLRSEQFIAYQSRDGQSPLDGHRTAIAEKGGFRPNVSQRAPSITMVVALVAAGSGIAIVPESLHYMNVPSVVFRPLADIDLVSEVAVAYRRDVRSAVVCRFLAGLGSNALAPLTAFPRSHRSLQLDAC
jgi:DNA-binding transcriptional LysR family regulator